MKNFDNKLLVFCLFFLIFINGCSLKKGYIKFEKVKNDEIIPTKTIKNYMKSNESPSIVLRVPAPRTEATQADNNNSIYNAIEKEQVLAGFNVKDRGLFETVISKSSNLDYSKVREITGTDLILELVRLERNIPYITNRAYTIDDDEHILKHINITKYGAVIEFKIIVTEKNEYGGSYSFYYSPCVEKNDDCYCKIAYKNYAKKRFYGHIVFCKIERENIKNEVFEYVPNNILEEFVRSNVKKMLEEIKK